MQYYQCSAKDCEYVCEETVPETCPVCEHPHFHPVEESEISDFGWCCLGQDAGDRDEWEKAVHYFTKGCQHDDPLAKYGLAWCYETAYEDYDKAIPLYLDSAKEGIVFAQHELAVCYLYGEGVAQDSQKAAFWFRRAAEQGHPRSLYELGRLYETGNGVEKNSEEAATHYMGAAMLGNVDAMIRFAACLLTGIGIKQNDKAAAKWYREASEHGNMEAAFQLARMLDEGKGVHRDRNEALRLYLECADCELEEARALLTERGIPYER